MVFSLLYRRELCAKECERLRNEWKRKRKKDDKEEVCLDGVNDLTGNPKKPRGGGSDSVGSIGVE